MGDRLATVDMGRKLGAAAVRCLFPWVRPEGQLYGSPSNIDAWAEAYLGTKWHHDPSNRLATIHQRYSQTDRQDIGPVA